MNFKLLVGSQLVIAAAEILAGEPVEFFFSETLHGCRIFERIGHGLGFSKDFGTADIVAVLYLLGNLLLHVGRQVGNDAGQLLSQHARRLAAFDQLDMIIDDF